MDLRTESRPRQPDAPGLDLSGAADAGPRPAPPRPLPQFLRKAWASVEARGVHAERIERVAKAWAFAEWRSADALRPCALVSVLSPDYAEWTARMDAANLSQAALRVVDVTPRGTQDAVYSVEAVVGSRRNVKAFRAAWVKKNNAAMGALLGYPACCCAFFESVFAAGKAADPVWLIGRATPGSTTHEGRVSVEGRPATNVLLRRIGVRAIPHFPCSFACEASRRLSGAMTQLACAHGHATEMQWLDAMLDWPMRWSALHGIAEIRTPVLKLATHTDPTAEAITLDWSGGSVPEEAAKGLDFPYRDAGRSSRDPVSPPPLPEILAPGPEETGPMSVEGCNGRPSGP